MVEGARLESVYTGNCIASSNLAVSANKKRASFAGSLFIRPCSPVPLLPVPVTDTELLLSVGEDTDR